MIDFKGGPLDGSASLEREIKAGESYSFLEMVIMVVGATSGYRYNIGHHFHVPSLGLLTRTVVRRAKDARVFDSFEYEIIDRLESEDELLLVAKFICQRPDGE
jgi:hypothetical protein